jgi:hypothetical protein
MSEHLIDGEFQSDKYPTCPRGKVPLSTKDPTAQDLLAIYAKRRRSVDPAFADDLEQALTLQGFDTDEGRDLRPELDLMHAGFHRQQVELARLTAALATCQAALERAVALLSGVIADGRIPQSCGACGTPDAACDCDCMGAAYLYRDLGQLRDALTASPNPLPALRALWVTAGARNEDHDVNCPLLCGGREETSRVCECGKDELDAARAALPWLAPTGGGE